MPTILSRSPDSEQADWTRPLPVADPLDPGFLAHLDAATAAWAALVEGVPGAPLSLAGGATAAGFQAQVRRFRAVSRDLRQVSRRLRALEQRFDRLAAGVMDWLMQYRCVVRFDRDVGRDLLAALAARTASSYRPVPSPAAR